MEFKIIDIENAYRKLKSYIYYDNFFLYLREQIASFETSETFAEDLERLCDYLNDPSSLSNKTYFNRLLKRISDTVVPKRYESKTPEQEEFIITNRFVENEYKVIDVNYLIDAPVEIHIISILWILREGYVLQNSYHKSNFAYSLMYDLKKNKVVDGLRLFKPYFTQYQKWRDKAIDTAHHFLKEDKDVLMISLDIKQYFYNIDLLNKKERLLEDLAKELPKKKGAFFLTELLFRIHKSYQENIKTARGYTKKNILPIGLLSSGVIGNWYLKDFDEEVLTKMSPAYYGRYVDDVIIVLSNATIPKSEAMPKTFVFDKFLCGREIFKKDTNKKNENDIRYKWIQDPNIEVQKNKVAVYAFDSRESSAVLEKFQKNIRKNSSAFWFLPDEEDANDDFDESVYDLTYTDTINKIRSIQGIKQSKYGASVYLAKKIKLSLLVPLAKEDKTADQVLTFFRGRMNLEFYSIWEKALTFFLVTGDQKSYLKFIHETIESIDKLANEVHSRLIKLKNNQYKFLINSIALSLSLNPKFLTNQEKNDLFGLFELKNIRVDLTQIIDNYRKSNLFRDTLVSQSMLNYCENNNCNYLKSNDFIHEKLEFSEHKLKFAPRFVYLHEIIQFYTIKRLCEKSKDANVSSDYLEVDQLFLSQRVDEQNKDKIRLGNFIHERAIKLYHTINFLDRNAEDYYYDFGIQFDLKWLNGEAVDRKVYGLKKLFADEKHTELISKEEVGYDIVEYGQHNSPLGEVKIAIANLIVDTKDIEASMLFTPNLSRERRSKLIDVLNQAEKCNADILVLPEVSIPHQWLPMIADESRRKQRVIIGGLEHIRINNVCFNLVLTCIPVEKNGIKDVVVTLRLKNNYSPNESKMIRNNGKIIPFPKIPTYNKFIWRKVHFSIYNCYELANIKHRSLFKSDVDLLFATEYNRDVNYFSNITETISRDVHCYFIQVNSSDHGDSRITKPSRTETKDLIRLKGGKNSVVLYDEINLDELRRFQMTEIDGQKGILFKNTPPDYDHKRAEDRFNKK